MSNIKSSEKPKVAQKPFPPEFPKDRLEKELKPVNPKSKRKFKL